ncbi:MAG: hypothetical protein PHC58_03630 [Candidatus Omnitrophica bacterium]|nr:hypothetical protein [Candidatus Omnitrophota bacterium]
MKKDFNNKQKWQKPEITKIKLNPEQAVLSCCDLTLRAAVYWSWQCFLLTAGCATVSKQYNEISS